MATAPPVDPGERPPVETRCISVPEAAKRLGIGISLAKAMAADGRLPSIRLGNRRVVPVAVLEALIGAKGAEARALVAANGRHAGE
ncbi:MAG: helix-turn-helix domain-containing protein [Chloroflexota bacterium]|nr:helix-turn-helix domain-containing protein [Chloroflexota bacterium]